MNRFLFWMVMSAAPVLWAQENDTLFAKAHAFYEARDFVAARDAYQKLVDQGSVSGALFYNLANTYYRTKQFGMAVFYYEKALRLHPADEDVRFNLELTRLQLKDKIVTPPRPEWVVWMIATLQAISLAEWGFVLVCIVNGFVVLLVAQRVRPQWRMARTGRMLRMVWIALLCINTSVFLWRAYSESNRVEAVILVPYVEIKNEPIETSTTVFILHEGTKAVIRSERNEWLELRLDDGNVGWIKRPAVGIL